MQTKAYGVIGNGSDRWFATAEGALRFAALRGGKAYGPRGWL